MIDDLNKLQLLNCLENCYYRDESDSPWVDGLYQDVKDDRPEELVMREYDRVYDEEQGREREFVRTYHPEIPFTPNLPFITEMPSAQFTPARSPDLRDIAEEMYEDAIEGAKEDTETE